MTLDEDLRAPARGLESPPRLLVGTRGGAQHGHADGDAHREQRGKEQRENEPQPKAHGLVHPDGD